jgi:hypothetical protein
MVLSLPSISETILNNSYHEYSNFSVLLENTVSKKYAHMIKVIIFVQTRIRFTFEVNFNDVQNDPMYFFLKTDLISLSFNTTLIHNTTASSVPWMTL